MQATLDAATGAMAPALVTDPITRNAYTPYGAVRGADNFTISKGWLNQVSDEASTGLTYLNARYYDSGTSRFVSPDPLMNPMDPKTLDAFRYADNNPVSFTDATGLCAAGQSLGLVYNGSMMEHTCYYEAKVIRDSAAGGTSTSTAGYHYANDRATVRQAVDVTYTSMMDWLASDDGQFIADVGEHHKGKLDSMIHAGAQGGVNKYWTAGAYCLGLTLCRTPYDAAKRLHAQFPSGGPWDAKRVLREELNLPGDGDRPNKILEGDGIEMYYDVLGNVAYGIMMSRFNIAEQNAIDASNIGGDAGIADANDDPLISLGYQFAAEHPGDFTADDLYGFLMSPPTLRVLSDSNRTRPPGSTMKIP
jgi:RHS repeat-associated protein